MLALCRCRYDFRVSQIRQQTRIRAEAVIFAPFIRIHKLRGAWHGFTLGVFILIDVLWQHRITLFTFPSSRRFSGWVRFWHRRYQFLQQRSRTFLAAYGVSTLVSAAFQPQQFIEATFTRPYFAAFDIFAFGFTD